MSAKCSGSRSFTYLCALLGCLLLAGEASAIAATDSPVEVDGAISHTPNRHGGDTSGALFLGAAVGTEIAPQWLLRLHASTGLYTDQAHVGRSRFTPLRLDVRRFVLGRSVVRPFVEVSPMLVFAHFSPPTGFRRCLAGQRVGAGVRVQITNRMGVDLSGSYMRSSSTTDYAFDVGPREINGLSEAMIALEPYVRFGRLLR